jgi:hypothetical protein
MFFFCVIKPCEFAGRHAASIFRAEHRGDIFFQNVGVYLLSAHGVRTQKKINRSPRSYRLLDCVMKCSSDWSAAYRNTMTSARGCEKYNLHTKYTKMKIDKIIILPVVLYGCETWSVTLRGKTQA